MRFNEDHEWERSPASFVGRLQTIIAERDQRIKQLEAKVDELEQKLENSGTWIDWC
jgi:hypothetical protein